MTGRVDLFTSASKFSLVTSTIIGPDVSTTGETRLDAPGAGAAAAEVGGWSRDEAARLANWRPPDDDADSNNPRLEQTEAAHPLNFNACCKVPCRPDSRKRETRAMTADIWWANPGFSSHRGLASGLSSQSTASLGTRIDASPSIAGVPIATRRMRLSFGLAGGFSKVTVIVLAFCQFLGSARANCPSGSPAIVNFLETSPVLAATGTISPNEHHMAVSFLFNLFIGSRPAGTPISVGLLQYGINKTQIVAIGNSYVGFVNTVPFSIPGSFSDGEWHHVALTWRKTDGFAKYGPAARYSNATLSPPHVRCRFAGCGKTATCLGRSQHPRLSWTGLTASSSLLWAPHALHQASHQYKQDRIQ
jgi:hypothetical protein